MDLIMKIEYTIVETTVKEYTIIASDDGVAGHIEQFGGIWEFNPTGDYTFELSDLKKFVEILESKLNDKS